MNHYWRKASYEALQEFEKNLRLSPQFIGLAEYASLREQGLRKKSLGILEIFITGMEKVDFATRKELVKLICLNKLEAGSDSFLFDPQPLVKRIILPTLDQWMHSEPDNPEPYSWKGILYGDADSLSRALQLDPSNQHVLVRLIGNGFDGLSYATHHLDEGLYIGSPQEDIKMCNDIRKWCDRLSDCEVKEACLKTLNEYVAMIQDWLDYKQQNITIPFTDYCAKLGHRYGWPKKYYY